MSVSFIRRRPVLDPAWLGDDTSPARALVDGAN